MMPTDPVQMVTQEFPYPHELEEIVSNLVYKPGWTFKLFRSDRLGSYLWKGGRKGLCLKILTFGQDYYSDREDYRVPHFHMVPAERLDKRAWQRWVFDRIMDVEAHEAMEAFIVDGERPYAPLHYPGSNPYVVTETATGAEKDIDYRGWPILKRTRDA